MVCSLIAKHQSVFLSGSDFKVTYQEAQSASPIGAAVYANVVMKEIVWPKYSLYPFMWLNKGYKQCRDFRFCVSDEWQPLEEEGWKFKDMHL